MAAGDFGVTHVSGLSVGYDPARGDRSNRDRASGAVLSVGTNNLIGIKRISSGTFTLGSVALGTAGSSVTTFVANGLDSVGDYFNVCADSELSKGLAIVSFISERNVAGLVLSSNTSTALTTDGKVNLRWLGFSF